MDDGSVTRICTVPTSVSMLSQSNAESLTFAVVGALFLTASVVCCVMWVRRRLNPAYRAAQADHERMAQAARRRPAMVGASPFGIYATKHALWYIAMTALSLGLLVVGCRSLLDPTESVSRTALERGCGVEDVGAKDMAFQFLEDHHYPYLHGETRYLGVTFARDGVYTHGGVALRDGRATLYQGDFPGNITVNVQGFSWGAILAELVFVLMVAGVMLFAAMTLVPEPGRSWRTMRPYEHPVTVFVMMLCTFVAVLMMAISLSVLDANLLVPLGGLHVLIWMGGLVGPPVALLRVRARRS